MKKNKFRKKSGFTLIELLIVVAIIAILAGLSFPFYHAVYQQNNLDIATTTLASSYRRAAVLSQAADGDATWGVKIQTGVITVFQGTSYAARDTVYDEDIDIGSDITITGVSEIVFTKLFGLPGVTGTTTLDASTGEQETVTINSKGMVSY